MNLRIYSSPPEVWRECAAAVGKSLSKIRVVLAEMPPMLRDIVRDAVSGQPDMEVAADSVGRTGLQARAGADVVVVGVRRPDDSAVPAQMFGTSAGRLVLAIALSGRSATLWRLKPHKAALGEVSPQSLVAAIRAGVDGR